MRGEVAGAEKLFPLAAGVNQIGSGASNHLRLDGDGVSRRHAVLVVEPRRTLVIDHGSKNGTFLNGRRIGDAEVQIGDTVAFGPVELRLEAVHPDDARLAFEVRPAAADPRSMLSPHTTASALRARDDLLTRWLGLLRRFAADSSRRRVSGATTSGPRGGLAEALTLISRELDASGAGLIDFAYGSELGAAVRRPVLAAAGGDVEALERAFATWRADFADQEFRTDTAATWVSAAGRGTLLIAGDFLGREQSADLLAIVLELCAERRPSAGGGVERRDDPELRFSPGFVRGASPVITSVYAQMRPLVQGDLPVLIVGETGVGKDLFAEILHRSSPRGGGPLVAINCAAIPAELLEAELFGIGDRVATGVAGRVGKFRQAEGGTLLLDEIGEMPADLQVKLLRVLQDRQVHPVGSSSPVPIDVRILAATNADIYAQMDDGRFRRDLFFRVAGFVLKIPPLRERRDDVPLLVEHFIEQFAAESGKTVRGLSIGALRALVGYDWPGNVRELEHEVRRLVYLCPPGLAIESTMLTEEVRSRAAAGPDLGSWVDLDLEAAEQRIVEEALRRAGGNQVQAAKLLGISRHALWRRLKRSGQPPAKS